MSKTYISHRLLFDSEGIIKINEKLNKTAFAVFIYNLMYINTNAKPPTKKNHIITSKRSFDDFASKLANKIDEGTFSILEPAIRPQEKPAEVCSILEQIDDEIKRMWEYSVYVSSEYPYQSIIFTSHDKMSFYEEYKAKDKKENIIINDENEAIDKIEKYHLLCLEDKPG
jgi:hypothetical protein